MCEWFVGHLSVICWSFVVMFSHLIFTCWSCDSGVIDIWCLFHGHLIGIWQSFVIWYMYIVTFSSAMTFTHMCLHPLGAVTVLQGAAVCCSVLQSVVVGCSVLQCAAACCSGLQLQCVAVCGSVLRYLHQLGAITARKDQNTFYCTCGVSDVRHDTATHL